MKDEILEFVDTMTEAAGFDLEAIVEAHGEPGDYRVVLSGDDRGLLLSRGAELLDAIEYVTNRAFGKQMKHDAKIVFDCGNYRKMREQELRLMAIKAAERVRDTRQPFTFEAMSPSERRIIHVTLAEDATVSTESVGDGSERKVRVVRA
ncbi:MAG: single-stranded DNA-binding protein [Blastocatellia bacterium]|nr:single-stranded DNA-binding protein [Blastocatellia bacterium]MBK6426873.1 single-stranded DNA-binding protein [Blastocatellia bacterium]